MSAYGALAGAYDALLADGDYLRRGKAIAKALKKSPIPVRHVLDLGCGTGTIACYLAAEGYRVTATDLSEARPWAWKPRPFSSASPCRSSA